MISIIFNKLIKKLGLSYLRLLPQHIDLNKLGYLRVKGGSTILSGGDGESERRMSSSIPLLKMAVIVAENFAFEEVARFILSGFRNCMTT